MSFVLKCSSEVKYNLSDYVYLYQDGQARFEVMLQSETTETVSLSQMLEGSRVHLFHVWRYWALHKSTKKSGTLLPTLNESILSGYLKNGDSDAVIDSLSSPHLRSHLPPVYKVFAIRSL